ncbi:hypothetical protein ABZ345_44685 [Lentzea sp. NPDC005914]
MSERRGAADDSTARRNTPAASVRVRARYDHRAAEAPWQRRYVARFEAS